MTVNTRRLVAVVLATALLAACGGSQEPKSVVTGELGPISQRLADLTDRFDDDVNAALATMVEEAIAACMKEQGFDYTPRGWNASDVAQLTDMPDPASAEYAELYGYGITTTDDAPRTLTLPGTDDPQMTDPAYVEALQGKPDDGPVWKPGGCYGQIIDQFDTYRLLTSTVLRDIARF
ncbi:MAG: hypothetical protein FWE61_04965, partial [Micrococcales bacterium]|nr:hypothetical protein [Micrococcales bacterium]